jgi:hypothetical protein
MTKLYLALSGIFWVIRQFFMPNPFEVLGEGITVTMGSTAILLSPDVLNWIAGFFVPALTFAIVGLYYSRGSCPAWGSFLYMLFFCLHTFILYLMSWAYPSIFLIVLIAVVYIGLHVGGVILKRKIYEW